MVCDAGAVREPDDDVTELLDEVFTDLEAADGACLAELEPAQVEAWVSSLLAAWRSDLAVADPSLVDRELLARCVTAASGDAVLICRAVEALAPASNAAAAAAVASLAAAGVDAPDGASIGRAEATEAWVVEPLEGPGRGSEAAVIVGFIHPNSIEHVVLADLTVEANGVECLVGLRLDGPAAGVLPLVDQDAVDDDEDGSPSLPFVVTTLEAMVAARRIVDAWLASEASLPEIDQPGLDLLLVNQLVVAARLRTTLGANAPAFLSDIDRGQLLGAAGVASELSPPTEELDAETAAANAASLRTLRAALRSHGVESAPAEMVDVVASLIAGVVPGLTADETEAVGFLEWADWLGALIGLVRGGAGTEVTPSSLVDLINRCAEISSTIPKADRQYVEFAFSVVLDLWTQADVVSDGRLTADGHRSLVPAAEQAWGPR